MKDMKDIIEYLKTHWSEPSYGKLSENPLPLICTFDNGDPNIKHQQNKLPVDLINFWSISQTAQLFKDVKYGQWGLEIFSLTKSKKYTETEILERPTNYTELDLIIGHFIGDSDLLLVSLRKSDFGKIIVSLPLYDRNEWYVVADSFREFLERYIECEGEKYWEK